MVPAFKILSDFDGVWTEADLEAVALHRQLVESCIELLGSDEPTVEADLAAFRREVQDTPHAFGWAPDGRISAFADEDPLCEVAGLCLLVAVAERGRARRYREAIEARWPTVQAFAEHGFVTAMARFRAEHPPSIATDAREQLHAVTEAGAEVVVVSNSEPGKLLAWFRAAGIDAGEGPGHELRIRGSAGKQVLGGDLTIDIRGRRVYVDRPRYREAIEQERPDLVIGDIFSLDLALPHVMRDNGHPAAPRTLALRRHRHTPAWILEDRAAGAIDHVVDRFGDLAELVEPER
ncbi:hypothetical protein [Paraliomyxa miuraensis]|uniref:hypothetical protein n=1 Tax=Paraliomyxa miuraensis TaxID=376150 RepID=UPI002257A90D|nr:hypothetical protein [Paraliomyxa miuraensis]MCX4246263.1 hypothetical protein [Paraliomyxa miuraensis]